jgi:hypothetical protein
LRDCVTSPEVAGSIPDGFMGIFTDLIFPVALGPWGPFSF